MTSDAWIPVADADGAALSIAEQRRLTRPYQPLPDARQLSVTGVSPTSVRVVTLNNAGHAVRTQVITSATEIAPDWAAVPSLTGNDPIVTVDVYDWNGPQSSNQLEQITLRLTASGAAPALHLDNAYWGDTPIKEYRAADGVFYQLLTSRTVGVKILRFALGTTAPAPTASAATSPTVGPSASPSPALPSTIATTPTPSTAVPQPRHRSAVGWLILAGGIAMAIAVGAANSWIWRRNMQSGDPA